MRITDEMVEKAGAMIEDGSEMGGSQAAYLARLVLESIAPDIWNAAVERCAEWIESEGPHENGGGELGYPTPKQIAEDLRNWIKLQGPQS